MLTHKYPHSKRKPPSKCTRAATPRLTRIRCSGTTRKRPTRRWTHNWSWRAPLTSMCAASPTTYALGRRRSTRCRLVIAPFWSTTVVAAPTSRTLSASSGRSSPTTASSCTRARWRRWWRAVTGDPSWATSWPPSWATSIRCCRNGKRCANWCRFMGVRLIRLACLT